MSRTRLGRTGRIIPLTVATALMASVLPFLGASAAWAEDPAPPPGESQSAPAEVTPSTPPETTPSPTSSPSGEQSSAPAEVAPAAEGDEVRELTGTVTDSDGGALAGVQITLMQYSEEEGGYTDTGTTAQSDVDGGYTLAELADGTYTLLFELAGYRTAYLGGSSEAEEATSFGIPSAEPVVLTAQLVAVGTIRGIVTEQDGGPLAGIDVILETSDGEEWSEVATTATASDGSYTLADLPSGSYRLSVEAFATPYRQLVVLAAPSPLTVDIVVPSGAWISGTVSPAPSGADATGYLVVAYDRAGNEAGRTRTGSTGEYQLKGLEAGEYAVAARPEGFATRYHPSATTVKAATFVDLAAAQRRTGVDIALTGSVVRGTVRTQAGVALAGASVALVSKTGAVLRAETDSQGRYAFRGLAAGRYAVLFDEHRGAGTGYLAQWWGATGGTDVQAPGDYWVSAGEIYFELGEAADLVRDAALRPAGRVAGTIDGDDAGGVNSAVVTLYRRAADGALTYVASSDVEDSAFRLDLLAPGSYLLHVDLETDSGAREFWWPGVATPASAQPVVVTGGNTRNLGALAVPAAPTGSVNGTLTLPEGSSGFEISLYNVEWEQRWTTTAAEDGSFAFPAVPAGQYRLLAVPDQGPALPTYYPGSVAESGATTITVGSEAVQLDAFAPVVGTAPLTGRVTVPDTDAPDGRRPVAEGTAVTLYRWTADGHDSGVAGSATTDAEGWYTIAGLHPGTSYVLKVEESEDGRKWLSQPLVATGTNALDADLPWTYGSGSISGTVTGGGLPRRGINVTAIDADGEDAGHTRTAADGGYTIADLYPGSYTVRFGSYAPAAGYFAPAWLGGAPTADLADRVDVTDGGQAAGNDIELSQAAGLSGAVSAVVDYRRLWVPGATVSLHTPQGAVIATTQSGTASPGSYGFTVPAGQYKVCATPLTDAPYGDLAVNCALVEAAPDAEASGLPLADAGLVTAVAGEDTVVPDISLADGPTALVGSTPEISGPAFVGSTLTAVPGTWTPGATLTYQWYADGRSIAKATGATFRLTSAQAGRRITVKVTGTLPPFPAVARTSAATAKVITAPAPTISGSAVIGATLTARPGSWTRSTRLSYRWLADGVAIAGATRSTYRVSSAVAGRQLSVRVTGTLSGYATVSRTSAPTARVMLTALPTISGVAVVGSPLVAGPGAWTPGVTWSYQWYADGKAIRRATGSSYTPTSSRAGTRITVKVTGQLGGYATASRTSAATRRVMTATTPRLSGTLAVGSTLTLKLGTWTSRSSFTYSWLRDGAPIAGATKSSYKLGQADEGHQVSATVTGRRSGYATVTRTTAPSPKVVLAPIPTLAGTAVVGSTLTLTPGTWSVGTEVTFQWLRAGVVVAGATGTSYVVGSADEGRAITATVTGHQAGWATITRAVATAKVMKAGTPTISGRLTAGSTVSARVGSWTSRTSFSYQWRRDGAAIRGATRSTYRLTAADAGKQLALTVKGRRSGYTTVSRTSAPVTVSITAAGWYRVGVTIQPGTYAAPGGSLCYWEKNTSGWFEEDPPAVMSLHSGPVRLTVHPTDVWVYLEGCGAWRPMATSGPQATTFGEGDHGVGIDIAPGLYTAPGGQFCFWRRTEWAGVERITFPQEGVNGVIARSYHYRGQRIVEIMPGDAFFTTGGCGTWRRLGASDPRVTFSDGDFAVGVHLEPGIWESTTAALPDETGFNCVVWVMNAFGGRDDEFVHGIEGSSTTVSVTIHPEDRLVTSIGCGTFTRAGDVPPTTAPAARGAQSAVDTVGRDAAARRLGLDPAGAARQR